MITGATGAISVLQAILMDVSIPTSSQCLHYIFQEVDNNVEFVYASILACGIIEVQSHLLHSYLL